MAIDRKEVSFAAFLDMRAAFDTVDHELLLKKIDLRNWNALERVKSYLSDRLFLTYICGVKSKTLPLQMGVP
jgi:hypothetical protein